jgi:hypothetical protein
MPDGLQGRPISFPTLLLSIDPGSRWIVYLSMNKSIISRRFRPLSGIARQSKDRRAKQ